MSEKRDRERHKKRLKLRFGVGTANTLGFTEDISQEGLFITTGRIQRANTLLTVEMAAPDGESVILEGVVQWAKKVSASMARLGKKGGMGIKISRFISGQEVYRELCGTLSSESPAKLSTLSPAEVWGQHVNELDGIHAKVKEADELTAALKDQRTSPRIRSLNLTSYVPKQGGRQDHIISMGRTLDVSEGGVRLETHRHLDKGTRLELVIAIEEAIISFEGEVLYSEDLGDGGKDWINLQLIGF